MRRCLSDRKTGGGGDLISIHKISLKFFENFSLG
jgi:hypothetical protein